MIDVLLIDDEPRMLDLLSLYLTPRGYNCIKATSGQQALSLLENRSFQLVLLDVMMSEMDGWETCRRIREYSSVPIIMVTARSQTLDVIKGLKHGADDYVTKPYHEDELLARMETILRRVHTIPKLECNGLIWDESKHLATVHGQELTLTPIEFSLLGLFLHNNAYVFTREQLIERIWGNESDTEGRTVDSHIRNVRDKLRKAGFSVDQHLKTIYGVGYRWSKEGKF
ncbi:response regulator transcription factor [Ectobacillus sp. sgz5001026]|uniref:response regulator transcription factor n=1 Tax=Ectobacillus sp. sgz5001026 TaxID=3242473 RepID=UPI0036D350FF